MKPLTLSVALFLVVGMASAVDKPAKKSPREALQPFNHLIGNWKGTGTPEGTREQKDAGLWLESINWKWRFKNNDAWLETTLSESKYFTRGELRYLPKENKYQLTLATKGKETVTFSGTLQPRRLVFQRTDNKKKEEQRLVFSFLHSNRYLYSYEVKPQDRTAFVRQYQVGATKKGVPFASSEGQPECVVSGGLGTMKVFYKGKTYYVCCSGCKTEFNEHPDRYVKEFEAKKNKK
jgi:hypothetical protein